MDILKHTARKGASAFSLAEVVLALGILSFAFVSILGMIPTGLNTFHHALDTSIGSQIFQRVINDAEQTDFTTLVQNANTPSLRFFDEQGNEQISQDKAIYKVRTLVLPSTVIPYSSDSQASDAENESIATLVVQIVNRPGSQTPTVDPTTNLWVDKHLQIGTYSAMISQNNK